jgi:phosphate:Na+ symporter
MTQLAAYHTAYNVVGVAVLLPATQWFTRVVERMLPSRQTAVQRALDPSALASPVIAIETVRRVLADVLATNTASVSAALSGPTRLATGGVSTGIVLSEIRDFLSELKEPPETEDERLRMTSMLHALDHASRLAEVLEEGELPGRPVEERRATELCARVMIAAEAIGRSITSETALSAQAAAIGWSVSPEVAATLLEAERAAKELSALKQDHRATTLASVAPGELVAASAFARIDAARRLDRIAHHTWRLAAHLLGRGGH